MRPAFSNSSATLLRMLIAYAKDVLFADWLRQWLEQMQYAVERSTWDSYKVFAERHILPYFEPLKVTLLGLTPQMLQRYYIAIVKSGRLDGRCGLYRFSETIHVPKSL